MLDWFARCVRSLSGEHTETHTQVDFFRSPSPSRAVSIINY